MEKNDGKRGAWVLMPLGLAAVFLLCAVAGGIGYFEMTPPEKTCVSCHEIRASHARWTNSVHRAVSCKACHGGSADSWHALRENAKRVFRHVTEADHSGMRLSEEQAVRMVRACQTCHVREFEHWRQGGHGADYAKIFMDDKHNRTEQMADDCLRCHGMFYEGTMADAVAPLDTRGPWRFRDAALAARPVIPCLACHELHAPGEPFAAGAGATNAVPRGRRDTVAFYVRQEKKHFAMDDLAVPKVVQGERAVKVSGDPRQRLCTQCHAPNAMGQAGTGDDRTPTGVHEGISCASCHKPHSNDTRGSCVACHPRFSSCGLDVAEMDTTYRSRGSRHNIHTMRCVDCHTAGVPKRPPLLTAEGVIPKG